MPPFSVAEAAAAAGGTVLRGDPAARIEGWSIDTRTLRPGSAFVALRGTRTDGHEFLPEAARLGAVAALVDRDAPPEALAPPALIRVEDTVAALAALGRQARRKVPARVLGITGSTGKTTTKELLAAGLSGRRRVHRTTGNLNNHLGVPLTLLACPDDAEFQVIEMGMSAPGEIAHLAGIADPDAALVTNVRPVHLQAFRSVDDIAAAKGELYAVLRPDATSVVNLDDPQAALQGQRHAGPRVTFGAEPRADVVLEGLEDRFVPGATLRWSHGGTVRTLPLRLPGSHSARNALAALAGVLALGEDLDAAAAGMAQLPAGPGRGRVLRLPGGVDLVDDAYNSNPAAMASVLQTLGRTEPAGRRVLVAGDMLELGPEEAVFHRDVGRQAAEAGVALLVGVGPLSRFAVEAAARLGVAETRHEADSEAAARSVPGRLRRGDLVVVKGSRGVRLERVVEAIAAAFGEGAP